MSDLLQLEGDLHPDSNFAQPITLRSTQRVAENIVKNKS